MARQRTETGPGFLEVLDQEISSTEKQIGELKQRLAVLSSLRTSFVSKSARAVSKSAGEIEVESHRFTSKQKLATEAIADVLQKQQGPIPTSQLLTYLAQKGIKFGGQDPRNVLSVLLSRSKLFKAHGHRGWTLVGHR